MLRRRYQICLVIIAVLGVFYPAIFADFCSVDDTTMVSSLLNTNDWSLKGLFIPHGKGGLYYRPLLYLTFLLDKELWFLQGSFMHLENILLHLANSLLVYCIARQLMTSSEKMRSYLPLVVTLCFGLHPLTTEAVDWVSARPDLMAGTFVLLGTWTLLKFKLEHKKKYLLLSVLSLLMGMLCKEVALAAFPGAFLILIARNHNERESAAFPPGERFRLWLRKFLLGALIGTGSVLIFFLLRHFAIASNSPKIGMTLKFIFNDPGHTLFVFLRTFGFYMKKLYYPFPLNFTIVDVDPLYELLAMPLVAMCIYVAFRRTLISAIFLAGVFLMTPSFVISFNQIAWTPYAERYVYISLAFVMIASVLFVGNWLEKQGHGVAATAGFSCLLLILALTTFQRNMVWKTNLTLFTDTVEKSPDFRKAWNELGLAYYAKKDFQNAERCLSKAASIYSFSYEENSDLNLAAVLKDEGKEKEAEGIYKKVINKSKDKSEKGLEGYLGCLGKKARAEKNPAVVAKIKREQLEYEKKLYDLNKKAVVLYRMGNLSYELGDRQGALNYYEKAFEKFPPYEKKLAGKRIAEIEQQ